MSPAAALVDTWAALKRWAHAGMAWFRPPKANGHTNGDANGHAEPELEATFQPSSSSSSDELWIGENLFDPDTVPVEQWVAEAHRTDFNSLPQLLDLMPRARRIVKKLSKVDRHGYHFYRRLGARLICNTDKSRHVLMGKLFGEFGKILPAMGMVFVVTERWDRSKEEKNKYADFVYLYFTKLDRIPWTIEAPRGARAIYHVTLIYDDDDDDKKSTRGYEYHVAILDDESVIALREWTCDVQYIKSRRDGRRRIMPTTLKLSMPARFAYPPQLQRHAKEMAKREPDDWASSLGPDKFGGALFIGAANLYDDSTERAQITCERDGVALAFSIDSKRCPYFFRHRDREVTVDGKRARIFHAVVEHDRVLPNGKVIKVRSHYKGSRRFTWKGERVRIAPPEQSAKFFALGGIPQEVLEPKESTFSQPVVASKLRGLWEEQSYERGGYRTRVNAMEGPEADMVRSLKDHAHAGYREHLNAKAWHDYREHFKAADRIAIVGPLNAPILEPSAARPGKKRQPKAKNQGGEMRAND